MGAENLTTLAIEIERKFLVDAEKWQKADKPKPVFCAQTYLLNAEDQTIRVRILADEGFLTIKNKISAISRSEFEYSIPLADAKELLKMSSAIPIEKERYLVYEGNALWEVDVFSGENKGLIVAEIELSSEQQTFEKPVWLGREVSDDPKFYNASLQKQPFQTW